MTGNKSAAYQTHREGDGYRFRFYCDLSGALGGTTDAIYPGRTPEEALPEAWQREGRKHFNRCHKCGKWVIDAVYNADVLECVHCAPYEAEPRFCKSCGIRIRNAVKCCPACGKKLRYEGSMTSHDTEGTL